MNKKLLLLLFIPLLGFTIPGSSGIKSSSSNVSYFKNNTALGYKLLQSKITGKLDLILNKTNSTPSFISGKLTNTGYSNSTNKSPDAMRFLADNKDLFALSNPAQELKVISDFTDQIGMTHIKYQQLINGYRILPSELIVHFNPDGSIESVNGNYLPTPVVPTTPSLSNASAISIAENKIGSTNPSSKSAELVLYRKDNSLTLAYEVKLPSYAFPEMKVYVNADKGNVIAVEDGIRYDGPVVGHGLDLKGVNKTINTYLSGGKYYLIDATLPMYVPPVDSLKGTVDSYDANNDTAGNGYQQTALISDPNSDNNFNDNDRLKAAVNSQLYSAVVYNFYKSHYNRNSFDGKGGSMENVVHYKIKYNNAFWNGSFMSYGDGDGVMFSNLAGGLDVTAHEISHGLDQHTANLAYHLQSGAINESISDVFGSLVDSTNWLIGEDVYTPGIPGDALRSMQDPHNGQTAGSNGWQPASMDEFVVLPDDALNDWGGVHTNSGITNKAFYNVASVIGHWEAGQIWYRCLTTYLTSNASFTDLRNGCLSAAKDLYGASSNEYQKITDGFTAVGITSQSYSILDLVYDDGTPGSFVYENVANWELALKFTVPTANTQIQSVSVYIGGDFNSGTGHVTLKMYEANALGMPGTSRLTPYPFTPASFGWQLFTVTNLTVTKDFFVSLLYDGTNWAELGADVPPGNGRAYEYDPSTSSWANLTGTNNYTLFMRATVKSFTTDVEIDTRVPAKFDLSQNYPNPFNPSTTIKYALPKSTPVSMIVYDINGNKVAELVNNNQNAGTYSVTWNGKNDKGNSVASGIYYCKTIAGDYVKTNKMILMK
jgi:Zn-dependent metalloprotease